MFWYIKWSIFVDFILDLRRSLIFGGQLPLKLSEWNRNQSTYDFIFKITYFGLRRLLIFGGQKPMGSSIVGMGDKYITRGLRMESNHQKTSNLITHMTFYFHWFHTLTSRSKQVFKVTTFRIIWREKGSKNEIGAAKIYDLILNITNFYWFNILTFVKVVFEGRSNFLRDL